GCDLASQSHFRAAGSRENQVRWVQNGYKIRCQTGQAFRARRTPTHDALGRAMPTRQPEGERVAVPEDRVDRAVGSHSPQRQSAPLRELLDEQAPNELLAELELVFVHPRHLPSRARYSPRLSGSGLVRFRIGGLPTTG